MRKFFSSKQLIILIVWLIAPLSTLLPFFAYYRCYPDPIYPLIEVEYFHPMIDFYPWYWVVPMLFCLLLIPFATLLPCSTGRRNLGICAATVLNIIMSLFCYFATRANIHVLSNMTYIAIADFCIGAVLMGLSYVGCFVLALLPDRLFSKKGAVAPTAKQNSLKDRHTDAVVCKTCGEKLQQDGVCPACCERLAFFNHMMEDMKSSTKNTPVGHNTKS